MEELKLAAAKNIADRLDDYVKAHNTTREVVAQEIGCSRTALYQKLSGNSAFTLFEGYKLSLLFGCEVSEFFSLAPSV